MNRWEILVLLMTAAVLAAAAAAGPYNEFGVNGYIDENWRPANPLDTSNPAIRVNPVFRGWASRWRDYLPSDTVWTPPQAGWDDPSDVIGPATGDPFDIVSLGDLDASEIALGKSPGTITLTFGDPNTPGDPAHIRDVRGYDFVVFENPLVVTEPENPTLGYVPGEILAELAYVEVSSDGIHFVRFPSVSLVDAPVGAFGSIDPTNVYNLAGKHLNGYKRCTGTPFDLAQLAGNPYVLAGLVDLDDIAYVRIVDVPGSGNFSDEAMSLIDPNSYPNWAPYSANHGIFDAWLTTGSGGFDLEAVGVLEEQQYSADINLDGRVDLVDFEYLSQSFLSRFGDPNYLDRCDLSEPGDLVVDVEDIAVFSGQWLGREQWRINNE